MKAACRRCLKRTMLWLNMQKRIPIFFARFEIITLHMLFGKGYHRQIFSDKLYAEVLIMMIASSHHALVKKIFSFFLDAGQPVAEVNLCFS